MPQKWKWTAVKEAVAIDIFLGELSQTKIAEKHGISKNSLEAWLKNPGFIARLEELRKNMRQVFLEQDIRYVDKTQRITGLSRLAVSAREQYEARPLVKELRGNTVYEHFNDNAFNAFRGALDDIAKELGERKTITEVTGKDGDPLFDIEQKRAALFARVAPFADPGTTGSMDNNSEQ